MIADAQLAATQANGAEIAITNPGGIRADLTYNTSPVGEGNGVVTYGEAFTVQPFGNIMQTVTLTGAQLDAVLEQQWQPSATGPTVVRILQISKGFSYTSTPNNPVGDRVSNLRLNGVPITSTGTYRVSINNFLAGVATASASSPTARTWPVDRSTWTPWSTTSPRAPRSRRHRWTGSR